MITKRDILSYLLRRNLLTTEHVVSGYVEISEASRRNYDIKVISQVGPSYFLKQGVGDDAAADIRHEAAVYEFFYSTSENDAITRYMPRWFGCDSKEALLVLELLRDSQTLREYCVRRCRFSTNIANALGRALATIHSYSETDLNQQSKHNTDKFKLRPPWVLSVHRPDLTRLSKSSSANMQVVKIIQQYSIFCNFLDELRRRWNIQTFIHNDFKWDNCVIPLASGSSGTTTPKIIDWELAGLGDPCWDIGSAIAEYITFWLMSIPMLDCQEPDLLSKYSPFPLTMIYPAVGAFWDSYRREMDLDRVKSDECLWHAIRYAAARLIQTGYEQMQASAQLTRSAVCFLQVSLNILQFPEEAIITFLGPRKTQ